MILVYNNNNHIVVILIVMMTVVMMMMMVVLMMIMVLCYYNIVMRYLVLYNDVIMPHPTQYRSYITTLLTVFWALFSQIPNASGVLLGLCQLSLFCIYPSSSVRSL